MIWLAWRQHRRETLLLTALAAALAAYFIITGIMEYADYTRITDGMSPMRCVQLAGQGSTSDLCNGLSLTFYGKYAAIGDNTQLGLLLLPLLGGMFLGAPLLARELERGTFRLAWTQGITRQRWLWAEVGVVTLLSMLIAGAFIPLVQWWNTPLNPIILGTVLMSLVGILPIAYAAFAVALGIAAGAVLRRTVPAMFVTLVLYLTVVLLIYNFGRPNFLPPLTYTWDPSQSDVSVPIITRDDWMLYFGYVTSTGQQLDSTTAYAACADQPAPGSYVVYNIPGSAYTLCLHNHNWRETMIWQPADRFWPLQLIETGILAVLTAALLGLTVWLVRRRMA